MVVWHSDADTDGQSERGKETGETGENYLNYLMIGTAKTKNMQFLTGLTGLTSDRPFRTRWVFKAGQIIFRDNEWR